MTCSDKHNISIFICKLIDNLNWIFNNSFVKIEPQYYYALTKDGLKKDEDYIIGIKIYFCSPDGSPFYYDFLDTENFYRNHNYFSFNAYFVDKYTAKFKHDILDLLIKYAVNEDYV